MGPAALAGRPVRQRPRRSTRGRRRQLKLLLSAATAAQAATAKAGTPRPGRPRRGGQFERGGVEHDEARLRHGEFSWRAPRGGQTSFRRGRISFSWRSRELNGQRTGPGECFRVLRPAGGQCFCLGRNAQNGSGKAMTTAAASAAGPATALANAAVGPGSKSLVAIGAGQAVSIPHAWTPNNGKVIGIGAMSEGYGGTGQALQYKSTAVLDFSTISRLISTCSPTTLRESASTVWSCRSWLMRPRTPTTSPASPASGAETFFTAHSISLDPIAAGNQASLIYELNYNAGTPTTTVDGFGFTYQFVDPPVTTPVSLAAAPLNGAIPEPSTWAMMTFGFVGLAFASYRAYARVRVRLCVLLAFPRRPSWAAFSRSRQLFRKTPGGRQ